MGNENFVHETELLLQYCFPHSVCFIGVCVVLGFNVQLIEDVLRYRQTIITLIWIVYHVVFDFFFELVALKGNEELLPDVPRIDLNFFLLFFFKKQRFTALKYI